MWNEILNLAIKNGLWAVLFLGLFVFVIKDSSNREKKYQQTIKDLTGHLGIVKAIKEDVDEIKSIVFLNKKYGKSSNKSTRAKKTTDLEKVNVMEEDFAQQNKAFMEFKTQDGSNE